MTQPDLFSVPVVPTSAPVPLVERRRLTVSVKKLGRAA